MAKKTSKSSKPKSTWAWVKSNKPGKPSEAEKAKYAMEGFETGIARLAYKSPGVFDLAYFRHTGQWTTVYYNLSLEDCLERVKSDPFFEV